MLCAISKQLICNIWDALTVNSQLTPKNTTTVTQLIVAGSYVLVSRCSLCKTVRSALASMSTQMWNPAQTNVTALVLRVLMEWLTKAERMLIPSTLEAKLCGATVLTRTAVAKTSVFWKTARPIRGVLWTMHSISLELNILKE